MSGHTTAHGSSSISFAAKRTLNVESLGRKLRQPRSRRTAHNDTGHDSDAAATATSSPDACAASSSTRMGTSITPAPTASISTRPNPRPSSQSSLRALERTPKRAQESVMPATLSPRHGSDLSTTEESGAQRTCHTGHRIRLKRRRRHTEQGPLQAGTRPEQTGEQRDAAPGKRARTTSKGAWDGDIGRGANCALCNRNVRRLPRHRCRQCPDVQLCLLCANAAPEFHPGHVLDLITPEGHTETESQDPEVRRDSTENCEEAEGQDVLGQHHPGPDVQDDHANSPREDTEVTVCIPECYLCQAKLFELRYVCQTCPEAHFCYDCRKRHDHILKIATGPILQHGPDPNGLGDDAEGNDGEGDSPDIGAGSHTSIGRESDADGDSLASIDPFDGPDMENDEENQHGDAEDEERSQNSNHDMHIQRMPRNTNLDVHRHLQQSDKLAKMTEGMATAMRTMQEDWARMAQGMTTTMRSMQAMIGAAEDLLRLQRGGASGRPRTRPQVAAALAGSRVPRSLLNFPIDFGTLDPDDHEGAELENGDKAAGDGKEGSSRRWSAEDKQRLKRLKHSGLKDDEIALKLGRTTSAVSQQWRKQK